MDMNQYTLFLPLDEKFESEELSPSYIVRLMYFRFSSIKQLSPREKNVAYLTIKKTNYFDDA